MRTNHVKLTKLKTVSFKIVLWQETVATTLPDIEPPSQVAVPVAPCEPAGKDAGAYPSKESPPTVERAREQYAQAHGMEVDKVTEKMLEESDEGVEGWACKGLNCAAHGPLGNALYRSLRKNPKMAEAYKWLFDDIKKKFRQSWAMSRNFDFVATKRIHMVATSTKHEEVGTWKNSLQLEVHFGGVGIPEAERQAQNYISNCLEYEDREGVVPTFDCGRPKNKTPPIQRISFKTKENTFFWALWWSIFFSQSKWKGWSGCCLMLTFQLFAARETSPVTITMHAFLQQEAFVKWNSWTKAYNYLLVEKLVTKCEEEAWKEMAVMVDQGATFETESMKCQAMRKYAAYYNMALENVTMEMIASSPRGVRGWCEIQVTVPGINDKTANTGDKEKGDTAPTKTRRGKRGADSAHEPSSPQPKAKAKSKAKKEPTALQASENGSKIILAQLAKSQQIMNKICSHGDEIPSEWRWAKPFLEEYRSCISKFSEVLTSEESQDLTEFVDNLKLSSLDKKTMATFKKSYKDNYATLLALFVDRCSSLAAQILVFHKTFCNQILSQLLT